MTNYPGQTITRNGQAYTLVRFIGSCRWIAEDALGALVELDLSYAAFLAA